MADNVVIAAELREAGSSNEARRMRRERKLPAVLYGGERDARPITIDPRELVKIIKSDSGQNTIFKLEVADGRQQDVMIYDLQIDPLSHRLQHADLIRIAMDVEIEVSVPLVLVGEPAGVRIDGGVLDHTLRELVLTCLPGDIPESIEIDVTDLEMNQAVKVEDVTMPDKVTLVTELDQTVASVVPPVSEEDLEADLDEEGVALEGEEIADAEAGEDAGADAAAPAEDKDEGSSG